MELILLCRKMDQWLLLNWPMTGQSDRTCLFVKLLTFFLRRVMWLSNGEVSVNNDSCSQLFFLKSGVKVSAFFSTYLSVPLALESPAWLGLPCIACLLPPAPSHPLQCLSPQSYPVPFIYYFATVQSCSHIEQNMQAVLCFWCWLASQPKYGYELIALWLPGTNCPAGNSATNMKWFILVSFRGQGAHSWRWGKLVHRLLFWSGQEMSCSCWFI